MINTAKDQFLLYIKGVRGVGKTYLIKVFLFGLSIIERQEDVLLTASTKAVAANISGLTYYSALAIYSNQPICLATKLRLTHKKNFIVDAVTNYIKEVKPDDTGSIPWRSPRFVVHAMKK